MNRIPWYDNGLLITAIGAVIFIAVVGTEIFVQEFQYQEPVLQFELQIASETDTEEGGESGKELSVDEEKTAKEILTLIMEIPDETFSWATIEQRFPLVTEGIWLDVATSAAKRRYQQTANTILKKLILQNPSSLDSLFQYAKLASQLDDDQLAIERYQQLLTIHPNHQASMINLGLLLARESRHLEAIDVQTQAIEISSGVRKAKALSVRGSSYIELQQYPQALADFQASIEFRPAHAPTWRKLANTLVLSEANDLATLQTYDRAIILQTDYVQALHERGQLHWLRGDFAKARQDLEKVRAMAPDFQPARWTLLHLYLALDKRRSARDEIRWLRKQGLDDTESEFIDGLDRWLKKDFVKAHGIFAKHNTEFDSQPWVDYYLALSSVRSKKYVGDEVISQLQQLAQNPWMASVASVALAEAYFDQDQNQNGIAVLQILSNKHPQSHFYAYTLGRAYLDVDRYLEAASALQRAMVLSPRDSQTRLSLAVSYTRAEQFELALKTYEGLVASVSDHRAGRYNYALLLERLDRDSEAIEQLQQLLEIDQNNTNAQYRLADLHAKKQNYDQAITLLNEALAERPIFHRARELLADIYRQRGNLDIALEEVNRLLVLQTNRMSAKLLKSDVLRDRGDLQAAAEILIAIPREDYSRNTVIKLFNIGKRALDNENLSLAESCNRVVVEVDPNYDKGWVNLSSALNRGQQYQQTVTLLNHRDDLLVSNHKLVINLAQAYHRLGNSQLAVALLEPLQQQNILSDEGALVLADSYRAL